jgi:alanyl-tRNA synthetase
MTSAEIRETFINFFNSKEHRIVPSAPIVVKDDPTLMFTNSGMNQFKEFFLGNKTPENPRIADTQKCLRVSGKHNDLEEVGIDTYHHTMFEMLGNWSFGNYFKNEAIDWAWELLVDVYGIDTDRMYVTVFQGDTADNLPEDDEARQLWSKYMPADRILSCSKKDNFWEMGATGPCGPCTEIHVDMRTDEERAAINGRDLVNNDHPQVIEIWNLVFIQFNRNADNSLTPLPAKHVDTGMGFERLCMVLQGKRSNYDTDVFSPMINAIEQLSGLQYTYTDTKSDIAIRVIADHIRAVSFAIADGQLPSNGGAGYVIRRILRRAIRYGYSYLNLKEPFINQLVPVLASQLQYVFPELQQQVDFVGKVIKEEEASFLNTLGSGLRKFAVITEDMKGNTIGGKEAFELLDTFGFPIDLTRLLASENGLLIDENGFEAELAKQKARSRQDANVQQGDWVVLQEDAESEFVGYDYQEGEVQITRYRTVKAKDKEQYQLVFNYTPFYAESGGQVGDTGTVTHKGEAIRIFDTKKENNLIVHWADKLPTNPSATFRASVDKQKRQYTELNHSATHLLQEALREVLGDHVQQKGSLVNQDVLRFDFSHFSKVTDEELAQVEQLVNERIRANFPLNERRTVPITEAKALGAMALFGEKYGDVVRVIQFGTSVELCGGTHVKATGEIGLLKITTETSVAAGIRRIEAVTGPGALAYINEKLGQLEQITAISRNNADVVKGIQALADENAALKKELEQATIAQANSLKDSLAKTVQHINGVNYIGATIDLTNADAVKGLAYNLKQEIPNLFLVLGTQVDGKAQLTIMIDDELVKTKGWKAGDLIRDWAKEIQGGGGGQPFYATAGGKNPAGLPKVLELAQAFLAQ